MHSFKAPNWKLVAFLLSVYDFIAIHIAYFLALWVRFDCIYKSIPTEYLDGCFRSVTIYAVFAVAVFWLCHMYRIMWRYASYEELINSFFGSAVSSFLYCLLVTVLIRRMPLSYYLWGSILQLIFIIVPRFSYRLLLFFVARLQKAQNMEKRVMIIGAGQAGQMLLRDIRISNEIFDKVMCFIDDNPNKHNRYVEGVPVVGGREEILSSVEKYHIDKIYIAIPSATAVQKRDIISICNETPCEIKQLPGMYQIVLDKVSVSMMKDVAVEDLLGRDQITPDLTEVFEMIHGKTVLVTGGGGSIGSELCRQIAAHEPRLLIVFDIYENNAYGIQLELKKKYPNLNLEVLIGSVRDSRRLFQIFNDYRPEIVYHAAAHKHVPLMEDSPCEAIKNNPIGTYKTAYAAMMHGCERFVLISTDKAVNPTNIMGASKRLCEMIIQSFDSKIKAGKANELPQLFTHIVSENAEAYPEDLFSSIKTEFVAVRFGNVLGSNGSVIPVFKKQIEEGGPVTVTHPDIIRYFMTVPEAVSLVMLAGTYAHGGEIFVLDMGTPVKIDALARNLIRQSGLTPDVDIEIKYTGLRPGEKLYEEKLMAEEGLTKTENDLIHIGRPIPFDTDRFLIQLHDLMEAAYKNRKDIRDIVKTIVNTYSPYNAQSTMVKDAKYVPLTFNKE